MDFKGKVALVTGSARGIGKGIAKSFLERGAKVSICDINVETGTQTLHEFQNEFGKNHVIFTKCDVSKDEDFQAAYNECEKSFGALDILVNNAGIVHKELKKIQEVNFEGVVRGTELAIERMGKHNGGKGGVVVNIASNTGLMPFYLLPYYASTKAAVVHFTRIMGHKFHYGYHGVSIYCLCPGAVETELLFGDTLNKTAYNEHVLAVAPDFLNNLPSILAPKDIGEAAVRLINEERRGEVVLVDKEIGYTYIPPSLNNSTLGLED